MLEVLGNRILVKKIEPGDTTESGLQVIRSHVEDNERQAEVVAVGAVPDLPERGEVDLAAHLAVGDTIVIASYGGTPVEYEGEDYMFLDADGVLAKVPNG